MANFFLVNALRMGVVDALDDLILQPFFDMCAAGMKARDAVDYIDRQVKAIDLIENGELEWSVNVALLLISTHMEVAMIRSSVRELMNERSISMEVEDHRLTLGK